MSVAHEPTLREKRESRQAVATYTPPANSDIATMVETVLIKGDLSKLTPPQRDAYYLKLCEVTGLNPLMQPFDYLTLNNKLVLYAKKEAAAQLRAVHNISVTDMDQVEHEGVYTVTVKVQNGKGRTDMDMGSTNVAGLKGDVRGNAMMKAATKAKRRATLSICGLGLLDETEVETIPGATPLAPEAAGEGSPSSQPRQQRRTNIVVNPATGKEKDLENARNQREEWNRFTDKVQGFTDARDAESLKAWFSSERTAEFVAGWVFKDQAHEHVDAALDVIAKAERA